MRLLAFGHTTREIAAILQISIHATEKHRARIMRKLQVASRADLVRHAFQLGLLEGSDN